MPAFRPSTISHTDEYGDSAPNLGGGSSSFCRRPAADTLNSTGLSLATYSSLSSDLNEYLSIGRVGFLLLRWSAGNDMLVSVTIQCAPLPCTVRSRSQHSYPRGRDRLRYYEWDLRFWTFVGAVLIAASPPDTVSRGISYAGGWCCKDKPCEYCLMQIPTDNHTSYRWVKTRWCRDSKHEWVTCSLAAET